MFFGFIEKEVQLGFSTSMDEAKRHGSAVIRTHHGITRIPFTVDKPYRLKRPSDWAVIKMFRQVQALHQLAEPLSIEFISGKHIRVYQLSGDKPVLVQVSPRS